MGFGSVRFSSHHDPVSPSVVLQALASQGSAILILTVALKAIPDTYTEEGEIAATNAWTTLKPSRCTRSRGGRPMASSTSTTTPV